MNPAYEVLSDRLAELIEARHVLRETAVFFRRVRVSCRCRAAVSKRSFYSRI
jgi:hypothetical protein